MCANARTSSTAGVILGAPPALAASKRPIGVFAVRSSSAAFTREAAADGQQRSLLNAKIDGQEWTCHGTNM